MVGRRTVIIGAGVVGAALADELSARGWTDITVVDQGDLPATGGSSSHAPGLVFQANGSKALTEMARYTVEKFLSLQHEGQSCFLRVGGLEVATTPQRVAELHRRHGWLTSWGIESRIIDADECVALHGLLDRDRVLGGLHIPTDGLAKAVAAVQAQIDLAAGRGVRFLGPPRGARHQHRGRQGRRRPHRPRPAPRRHRGLLCRDLGPQGRCHGRHDPAAHTLGPPARLDRSDPALEGQTQEAVRPILRHQDADLYYRDKGDTLGIGYYGHRPMPIDANDLLSVDEAEVMPSVLAFTA
jgi:hypothetical protein